MKKILRLPLLSIKKILSGRSSGESAAKDWAAFFVRRGREGQSTSQGKAKTRVLCATSVGGHQIVTGINSLLAAGLIERGAEVSFLLCDKFLSACELMDFKNSKIDKTAKSDLADRKKCASCWNHGKSTLEAFPAKHLRMSDYVTDVVRDAAENLCRGMDLAAMFSYRWNQLNVGEQVRASVIRFFGNSDLTTEDCDELDCVARSYFKSAIVTAELTRALIERERPEVVFNHHGVYVPQGIIDLVAKSMGVRVVVWGTSYRDKTIIASHDDTYHRTFLSEPLSRWTEMTWNPDRESRILDYLQQRRSGQGDWPWVTTETGESRVRHVAELKRLGLRPDLPTFGLLTNVAWDAALFYGSNAFPDQTEWLRTTLDFFVRRRDLQLILRVHPHEVKAGNRQNSKDWIEKHYPHLPENVVVVDHLSPLNTYALMDLCRVVLIYGTKTGVELAPFGTPVVVAGEAWIRGRGFSLDVETRQDYELILDRLPLISPLTADQILRARMFAYHYFFRRMIPLNGIGSGADSSVRVTLSSRLDLMADKNPGLEVLCRGILQGSDFIYDDRETEPKCTASSI